jgi:indole-3-glycerol phosphate synthase
VSRVPGELVEKARADLAARQSLCSLDEVKARALAQPSAMDGMRALRGHAVRVIGELDAASPSIAVLAGEYELGGADAVSVPVASSRSVERLRGLREVRARVQVPLLCKDLVVSSYQLWEARAHGADLVLLTAAVLEQEALVSLVERAGSLGMSALVEVRDEWELRRAVDAGARIIAIGARDRTTREIDAAACVRLIPLIPAGIVRVAECGGAGRSDFIACARAGVDAVHLSAPMLAGGNPRATIAGLVSVGAHPALPRGQRQAV